MKHTSALLLEACRAARNVNLVTNAWSECMTCNLRIAYRFTSNGRMVPSFSRVRLAPQAA